MIIVRRTLCPTNDDVTYLANVTNPCTQRYADWVYCNIFGRLFYVYCHVYMYIFIQSWACARQKQQNDLCAQRRLSSAWASAQSDQSLRSPHEDALGPLLPIERTAKSLICLGWCPGWTETSLGAPVIFLVLSCCGSNKYCKYLVLSVS